MKKWMLSIALLSVCSLGFAATLQSLNKAQVMDVIKDKTVTTISVATLNGELIDNAFTGYFNKDNTIKGQFASKPSNDPQTDQGTWTVKTDGTVCATWQHWNQSKPICVSVYKLKNGLLFINQQNRKFESLILDENIKSGNKLS